MPLVVVTKIVNMFGYFMILLRSFYCKNRYHNLSVSKQFYFSGEGFHLRKQSLRQLRQQKVNWKLYLHHWLKDKSAMSKVLR